MSSEDNIKFDLLENGLDFILSSVKFTLEEKYKYAILHLSAGVELILKERLRQEHWSLIFENIDKAQKEYLNSGDFQSVKFESSLKRIIEICSINLSDENQKLLHDLKRRRNKIEHFAYHQSGIALKSLSSKILNFVFDFIHLELDDKEFTEQIVKQIDEIRAIAMEFTEFVKNRNEHLKPKINNLIKNKILLGSVHLTV